MIENHKNIPFYELVRISKYYFWPAIAVRIIFKNRSSRRKL